MINESRRGGTQASEVFVIPAQQPVSVTVAGGGRFPVRRVFCIARNYAAHAREMGGNPEREQPFFFCKPADAVLSAAEGESLRFRYPLASQDVHHEVELVVALGAGGENLDAQAARASIWGYAVGLDMTRRDLQAEAKAMARPWDIAKAFDQSAPVSAIRRATDPLPDDTRVALTVNGKPRQSGVVGDMIWTIPEIIMLLSRYYCLAPGDLIFTGTPEGVGAVLPGDELIATIDGVGELYVEVVAR